MIYLAIKYHPDHQNKNLIESITHIFNTANLECICIAQHIEKWGEKSFTPQTLMQFSFDFIRKSDFVLIEFSEKGVGVGIEAGYAAALNRPIYVIHPCHIDVSETLKGIASAIFPYDSLETLPLVLSKVQTHFQMSMK